MMKDRDLIIGEFRSRVIEIVKSWWPKVSDYLVYSKCHVFLRHHADDKVMRAMAEAHLDTLVAEEIRRLRRVSRALVAERQPEKRES